MGYSREAICNMSFALIAFLYAHCNYELVYVFSFSLPINYHICTMLRCNSASQLIDLSIIKIIFITLFHIVNMP